MLHRRRQRTCSAVRDSNLDGNARVAGRLVIRQPSRRSVALAQASYYLLTGVWPLVSPRTFQLVTGPKSDFWLAQTAGALIAVIGGAVATAAGKERLVDTATIRILAMGAALSLATVDITYVAQRRISSIYLADAAAELASPSQLRKP